MPRLAEFSGRRLVSVAARHIKPPCGSAFGVGACSTRFGDLQIYILLRREGGWSKANECAGCINSMGCSCACRFMCALMLFEAVSRLLLFCFFQWAGHRLDARNLLRTFYLAMRKVGIQRFRFHDLRHLCHPAHPTSSRKSRPSRQPSRRSRTWRRR